MFVRRRVIPILEFCFKIPPSFNIEFSEPVWPSGKASDRVGFSRGTSNLLRLLSLQKMWSMDTVLFVTLSLTINETLKWLSSLLILMQKVILCGDSVAVGIIIISLFSHLALGGKRKDLVRYRFGSPFSSESLWFVDTVLWHCPSLRTETLKWLSSLPILMQESFWWWQCSDRYTISLSPLLHTHSPTPTPSPRP